MTKRGSRSLRNFFIALCALGILAAVVLVLLKLGTGAGVSAGEDSTAVSSSGGRVFVPQPRDTSALIAERRATGDLLPDLVPLPPRDLAIQVREGDGAKLLRFSTTYYNQGDGPLELRADNVTAGVYRDVQRDILQRVYKQDGEWRVMPVGHFLWHQEHLHYHFVDFVEYDLEPVDAPHREDLVGSRVKSTFCVRDVSRVTLELSERSPNGQYLVCGKELQGVSVGWGDTYFFDYPDQSIDVTGLSPGTYRLSLTVNPTYRLEELRYSNNTSSALVYLDPQAGTAEVLGEVPSNNPEVEHVHLEQPFGGVTP